MNPFHFIMQRLPRVSAKQVRGDLIAGLTTAVMLIPQAMAYAMLAGLPPIVGLYASVAPAFAYALVGSSRVLAVGPVAMDSLLTAATVGMFAASDSEHYIELAALLALMVGAMQLLAGLVKGGALVRFLSTPVIGGFTSAAALIIGASQLKTLLGIELGRSSSIFPLLTSLVQQIDQLHATTTIVAIASMLSLWLLKRFLPRVPRALVVVGLAALCVLLGDLHSHGVQVIGDVPAGLPQFTIPGLDFDTLADLTPGALTIAMVAFMEGISISSKLATQTGHRVDANRELAALGLANIAAGLFRGYPVAGGLSRTAVNADAGAQSKLAGVITGAFVIIALLWFTPLLYPIPKATLGAIIVMAVIGLFDWKEMIRLWFLDRHDWFAFMSTFAATLLLGIQQGIALGVVVSLLLLLVRASKPYTAVLGHVPGTERFDDMAQHPDARAFPGVLLVRCDAPLFFASIESFRQQLAKHYENQSSPIHTIVLDASGISSVDTSALNGLRSMIQEYEGQDTRFILANVKSPFLRALKQSTIDEELGEQRLFDSTLDAIRRLGVPEQ